MARQHMETYLKYLFQLTFNAPSTFKLVLIDFASPGVNGANAKPGGGIRSPVHPLAIMVNAMTFV